MINQIVGDKYVDELFAMVNWIIGGGSMGLRSVFSPNPHIRECFGCCLTFNTKFGSPGPVGGQLFILLLILLGVGNF